MLKGKTALLVDDEELVREVLAFELRELGVLLDEASSGKEALEKVKLKSYDFIISDIRMPNGDGIWLLDEVKKINAVTPVVLFITGFADWSHEEAYAKGAAAFISKPFDLEQIVSLVETAIVPNKTKWKRKDPRFNIELDLKLKFPSCKDAISAKAINIGRGGMFIAVKENFPAIAAGIGFDIEFENQEWSPIRGKGIVRWVRKDGLLPFGIGMEFQEIAPESIDLLLDLIGNLDNKVPYIPKN